MESRDNRPAFFRVEFAEFRGNWKNIGRSTCCWDASLVHRRSVYGVSPFLTRSSFLHGKENLPGQLGAGGDAKEFYSVAKNRLAPRPGQFDGSIFGAFGHGLHAAEDLIDPVSVLC
jgi:hypothetical protein